MIVLRERLPGGASIKGDMYTPYDWQEGIGHRAQYIESKLAQGAPVLAVSLRAGIVFFTYRRQGRKIYEIYDRLIFGGLGQQSDVENLRVTALEFASREGFSRSEEDVTIQRLAVAISTPLKNAFADFRTAPFVARVLFGEIGDVIEDDRYFAIDFDGDYAQSKQSAAIAGSDEEGVKLAKKLQAVDAATSPADIIAILEGIWRSAFADDDGKIDESTFEGLKPEAVLLERSRERENRFRPLTEME